MPRQTRSTRSRAGRARRAPAPARSAPAVPNGADAPAQATPPAAATRTTVIRPQATPGSLSRGFVTDYNYVVSELKRIFILTAGIILLLLVLWFIIG